MEHDVILFDNSERISVKLTQKCTAELFLH